MSVCATSANGTSAPAPVIQSASIAAVVARRSGLLPLTTSVLAALSTMQGGLTDIVRMLGEITGSAEA